MSPIVVPFHQDERLAPGSLPVTGQVVAPTLPDGDRWARLVRLWDAVADAVAGATAPTVVSGDCLVALGVLAGVQRAGVDPSVLWFDAHGDVHTLESSTSGYLGGLSLRLAMGAHPERVAGPLGLRPLAEDRVTLVDARDLDPAEADYLATARVRRATVDEVEVPPGPVVLHLDVDVIDSGDLPGLLFPVSGGPSRAAVLASVRRVLDTGRVAALSVACPWRPGDDPRRAELLSALT
ncbi:arginase family protein [Actinophytocola gossypii]|uniref:Arginase family protein n=1 Tax=Actinophytocola gossypii TaxID=2812003 RepID=A0ABT2JAV7_9PSEU|nr:arginase family protein [Actinophytocola gossypii]MCT2584991.1 arginase family protein [Actinophytocola gossypii]